MTDQAAALGLRALVGFVLTFVCVVALVVALGTQRSPFGVLAPTVAPTGP